MNLWKVNGGSTRQLREACYRNQPAGQGRASALQAAGWIAGGARYQGQPATSTTRL
jgi:CHAT domain-containing protein